VNLDAFIATWDGRRADFPGGAGGQCVDLVEYWVTGNGFGRFFGNAIDVAGQRWSGAVWTPNTPTNVPNPGDVVVWGGAVGVNGHVDIFVAGDVSSFTGFDQNWPIGAACHHVHHDYHGVLGWQALGLSVMSPPPPPPQPEPPPPEPPPPVVPPVAVPVAGGQGVTALLLVAGTLAAVTYWRHRRAGVPVTLRTLEDDLRGGVGGFEHLSGRGLGVLSGEAGALARRLSG
jgi:hypothetical protein